MSTRPQPDEQVAPAVPATAKRGADAQDPRRWAWVEAGVWTECMLAALGNGVQGGKWYSLIDKVYAPRTLEAAWRRVERNHGAAGIDRVSVQRFKVNEARHLRELEESLRDGSYRPDPVRRVHIPKERGQTRALGIPTVKDRVVQAALKLVMEPIFEREFLATSYGFRPGRGCQDALREVDRLLKAGYTYVVDADLCGYFDSIPHAPLLHLVRERIADGRVVALVERFMQQDIMDGMERWTPISGSPQGAVLSPLLANLYLHPLDVLMADAGYRIVRYADDFVILCRTEAEAHQALAKVQEWTEASGLTLHPEKTHVGNSREKGNGFEFLGYRFEAGHRAVRKKSLMALRDKVRSKTKRTCGQSLDSVIRDLNPILRGWFGYFKHARKTTFRDVDGFVRRRLRAVLRKQNKKPGQGRCANDSRRWPRTFFADHGLFTMHEAHALASQSR